MKISNSIPVRLIPKVTPVSKSPRLGERKKDPAAYVEDVKTAQARVLKPGSLDIKL